MGLRNCDENDILCALFSLCQSFLVIFNDLTDANGRTNTNVSTVHPPRSSVAVRSARWFGDSGSDSCRGAAVVSRDRALYIRHIHDLVARIESDTKEAEVGIEPAYTAL